MTRSLLLFVYDISKYHIAWAPFISALKLDVDNETYCMGTVKSKADKSDIFFNNVDVDVNLLIKHVNRTV